MNTLMLELRLALHSRLAAGALVLLLALSLLSIWSGLQATGSQRAALERIAVVQRDDVAAVAKNYRKGGEAGLAGYYTPHLTDNPPTPLAFAAFGQRDVQPYSLRVRLLGLQAQQLILHLVCARGGLMHSSARAYMPPVSLLCCPAAAPPLA